MRRMPALQRFLSLFELHLLEYTTSIFCCQFFEGVQMGIGGLIDIICLGQITSGIHMLLNLCHADNTR